MTNEAGELISSGYASRSVNSEGRLRNANRSRKTIITTARKLFSVDSYDDVGLRDIGAAAGVDPALIIRYFGSKETLFAAALEADARDGQLFSGTISEFAERISVLLVEPRSGRQLESFLMMLQSATSQNASRLTKDFLERQVTTPMTEWLTGEDASIRAQMVLSVMLGVALARTINPESDLSNSEKDDLRLRISKTLMFCLTGA